MPVLTVAGENDVLAPVEAVHHVASLLPNSPDVRVETAPGGHLGVLTGRSARDADLAPPGRVPDRLRRQPSSAAAAEAAAA